MRPLRSAWTEAARVRIAGYLHDLGRVGVSSRIWDKPGPLSATERDQVGCIRTTPSGYSPGYRTWPMSAALAGQHHEHLDGTGYHRGAPAAQLPMPARVLAAADRYRSQLEPRPHPAATAADEAAAGSTPTPAPGVWTATPWLPSSARPDTRRGVRRQRPAGLTDRQVTVLRLVAPGCPTGRSRSGW